MLSRTIGRLARQLSPAPPLHTSARLSIRSADDEPSCPPGRSPSHSNDDVASEWRRMVISTGVCDMNEEGNGVEIKRCAASLSLGTLGFTPLSQRGRVQDACDCCA